MIKKMHLKKHSRKFENSRDNPIPAKIFPFPRIKWFLYLRSSIAAATVAIHGLYETNDLGKGPPFPAACATNTPAFTAPRSVASKGFKNVVLVFDGGLSGPTDRLSISTPSCTACSLSNVNN